MARFQNEVLGFSGVVLVLLLFLCCPEIMKDHILNVKGDNTVRIMSSLSSFCVFSV